MHQEGTSAVEDVLHGPLSNAICLRHARLGKLMSTAETHVPYRPNELVGVIGIYDLGANRPDEVLQRLLDLNGTLGRYGVGPHISREKVLHDEKETLGVQSISPPSLVETRMVGSYYVAELPSVPDEVMSHLSEVPHLRTSARLTAVVGRLMSQNVLRSQQFMRWDGRRGPRAVWFSRSLTGILHVSAGGISLVASSRERILATLE